MSTTAELTRTDPKMHDRMQWLVYTATLIVIMGAVCPIKAAKLNGNGYNLVIAINDNVETVTDFNYFLDSMKVSTSQFLFSPIKKKDNYFGMHS